jgi:hypothetical protein
VRTRRSLSPSPCPSLSLFPPALLRVGAVRSPATLPALRYRDPASEADYEMLSRTNVGDFEDTVLPLAGEGGHRHRGNQERQTLKGCVPVRIETTELAAPPGACAGKDERKESSRRAPESPPGPSSRVRRIFFERADG